MAVETIGVRRAVVKDQIYAAIERHRAALAAYNAAPDSDRDDAWGAYGVAHAALMGTRPATLTGTIASLNYIAAFPLSLFFGESADENEATIEFITRLRDDLRMVRQ